MQQLRSAHAGRALTPGDRDLTELKSRVAGRANNGGTQPDRTHEVWTITERLGIKACQ
jgi:hypothetical protein